MKNLAQNLYFNYEIYTIDPISKQDGWDIECVSVKANSRIEARDKLNQYPYFDCVILLNYQSIENETCDFFTTDRHNKPERRIFLNNNDSKTAIVAK